jgi:hypothetical protein
VTFWSVPVGATGGMKGSLMFWVLVSFRGVWREVVFEERADVMAVLDGTEVGTEVEEAVEEAVGRAAEVTAEAEVAARVDAGLEAGVEAGA